MFEPELIGQATELLQAMRSQGVKLATAESCTGGLIAGLFTEIPGSSNVVDRGFVTYSNEAKMAMLGVPRATLDRVGAVSRETAISMAEGALAHSLAQIAVAVTGVAGPGGGSPDKPVGLVHLCVARKGQPPAHREMRYGDIGRGGIRLATIRTAVEMIEEALALRR